MTETWKHDFIYMMCNVSYTAKWMDLCGEPTFENVTKYLSIVWSSWSATHLLGELLHTILDAVKFVFVQWNKKMSNYRTGFE